MNSKHHFIKDKLGHGQSYVINTSKLVSERGWMPVEIFETGLQKTVHWYLNQQKTSNLSFLANDVYIDTEMNS